MLLPLAPYLLLYLWTLYATYDWHELNSNRIGRELDRFVRGESSLVARESVVSLPKGLEGVKISEVKRIHEAGGFRKQYKNGREVLEWQGPKDYAQESTIGCFVRCRGTKKLLPPSFIKALDKSFVAQRYNLYYYADLTSLMAKFGEDIRKFDIHPSLSKREKFIITDYSSARPLWGVGGYLEETEFDAVQKQIKHVFSTNFLLKHGALVAILVLTWLAFVNSATPSPPDAPSVVRAAQKLIGGRF